MASEGDHVRASVPLVEGAFPEEERVDVHPLPKRPSRHKRLVPTMTSSRIERPGIQDSLF